MTRSCTIPKNKLLFFPLINHWATPPNEFVDEPAELADYLAFVNDWYPSRRAHTCQLTLRVDGHALLPTLEAIDEAAWTQELEPFTAVVNDDNANSQYGVEGGVFNAITEAGHYALLLPFAPGSSHVLELGGAICDDDGNIEFETAVTYNLTVGH